MRSIATNKYWLFYLGISIFTRTSFPPNLNFVVFKVNFDLPAAFTLIVRHHSCNASFRYLMQLSQTNTAESKHQKRENRIQRPSGL
jgi:predicted KAP-like P-loop ATPase